LITDPTRWHKIFHAALPERHDFLLNLKPNHLKRKTFLLSMTDVFRTSDFQKRQKQYFQVKKK